MTKFKVTFPDGNGLRKPSEEIFLRWFPEMKSLLKKFDVETISIVIRKERRNGKRYTRACSGTEQTL